MKFDWVRLPAADIEFNGAIHRVDSVAISFSPVTFGQFTEFMRETDYMPVPDTKEYDGFLVENFRGNYGPSPKTPLYGVTYDDAFAYCMWAHMRLPSEPELHHFFIPSPAQGKQSKWSGECWTSTSPREDTFVVRNGPILAAWACHQSGFARNYIDTTTWNSKHRVSGSPDRRVEGRAAACGATGRVRSCVLASEPRQP